MPPPNAAALEHPGYRRVWALAWPIILANSTVPLLGLVDTGVIGRTGRIVDLGAIALGALIFNFVYWSFGFLRMGTTGFAAQADGSGDEAEVRATLGRALLLATGIGVGLILLQAPVLRSALKLLGASAEVEGITQSYVLIRIWGAPASLALFALMGLLIGLGHSRKLLRVQLLLNSLNMVLDIYFAGILGWGAPGIALGTLVAEWTALTYAGHMTYRLLQRRRGENESFWSWERVVHGEKLKHTLNANADIMVRTLLLLFGFAWFTDQGARLGDAVLAGNHILLQFISFSAFFLDGFAFGTESWVGRAAGAGQRDLFDHAIRISTVLAASAAIVLSLTIMLLGPYAIAGLTNLAEVRETAGRYLPYAALYVLISFAAFQLDGIFIGTTRTRAMRNAAVLAVLAFLVASWPLIGWAANHGLWAAFLVFVVARAVALGLRYQALRASIV
jgi:MATE family multidrug resistance protein